MSIRMMARELYRVMKEVEQLEKELESLPLGMPKRDELERRLRAARGERGRIRAILNGAKAD
jgi:hypothetical protein